MRPLEQIPNDPNKPWYTWQRVGYNTLKGFVTKIFSETEVKCDYTNHSLRATSITRMFTSKVPEKIIAEKSGHRSLAALRSYEHTSCELEQAAGRAIVSDDRLSYDNQMAKIESSITTNMDPPVDADTKQLENSLKTALPTFSGKMENCTINFTFNK